MAERIDPALAARLDAFTVSGLPADFADRLIAAAEADTANAAPALPPLRRPHPRRWLRGGASGLGALALGMISISAAAIGYLGEPIRHAVREAPVIGAVVERVLPKAARAPKKPAAARLARPAPSPKIEAAANEPPVEEALPARRLMAIERRERMRAIMADPERRRAFIESHPRAARQIIRREQIRRQRIGARIVPPGPPIGPHARMPLQGPLRAMPGPMRRERLEQLRERRRERLERRGMLPEQIDTPPAGEAQP